MNKREPTDVKSALIAELLGDIDGLLARVEAVPQLLDSAEDKLNKTITVLESSTKSYQDAVIKFNEAAKKDLTEHITVEVSRILEEVNKQVSVEKNPIKTSFFNMESVISSLVIVFIVLGVNKLFQLF